MKSSRQDQILQLLTGRNSLSVEEAVASTGASPATVRRDFNHLAEQQLVERVHGGVRPARTGDHSFALRRNQNTEEKYAIACRAAAMLQPADAVFVDGGTTTLQLAACLPPAPLRIITNSVRFASALDGEAATRGTLEILVTGGYLVPQSGLLAGIAARNSLAEYHANWAFLSAGGVTADGIFNNSQHVVDIERVMIAQAAKVAVLADHSKIGATALCHISDFSQIDVLITNRHPSTTHHIKQLRKVVNVVEVDMP